jgi:prolyl-tRNA synthetase
MGCYGIGVSRIAASAIEQSHDEHGIIWPSSIAPFDVHLIGLNLEESDLRQSATEIYKQAQTAGLTVLFDDRDMRAGEKFADSDLIGIPARITISKKSLAGGGVELKFRNEPKSSAKVMSMETAITAIKARI